MVQVDSKKELEKQLKASCEAFIMAVTKLAVEPMLSFITKVTAVKVASLSNSRRLREQVRCPLADWKAWAPTSTWQHASTSFHCIFMQVLFRPKATKCLAAWSWTQAFCVPHLVCCTCIAACCVCMLGFMQHSPRVVCFPCVCVTLNRISNMYTDVLSAGICFTRKACRDGAESSKCHADFFAQGNMQNEVVSQ